MASIEVPGPRPPLFPPLPDHHLPYLVPALVYWILGYSFYQLEKTNFLSKYKLHTPVEILKKQRATKSDVIRIALLQQAAQITLGYLSADVKEAFYSDDYNIALLAAKVQKTNFFPYFQYPLSKQTISQFGWALAASLYWVVIPTLQFVFAMALADTWQYFTHRAFHSNKWLYRAFYNHLLETIPIDAIGFPFCLYLAGLNNCQAALFGAIWTFKTVVDHCGYNFPYNPCNVICGDSVLFHDLHHQQWGLKYNFSNYSSFWDKVLGTYGNGKEDWARVRYEKEKEVAEGEGSGGKSDEERRIEE